jgi:hypothetical protein
VEQNQSEKILLTLLFLLLLLYTTPSPFIPFVSKLKKMENIDGPDLDKSEWNKLEFLLDPDNPALYSLDFKYSRNLAIFKDGFPEKWINWVMAFREI